MIRGDSIADIIIIIITGSSHGNSNAKYHRNSIRREGLGLTEEFYGEHL